MICPTCGNDNPDPCAQFCASCGSALPVQPQPAPAQPGATPQPNVVYNTSAAPQPAAGYNTSAAPTPQPAMPVPAPQPAQAGYDQQYYQQPTGAPGSQGYQQQPSQSYYYQPGAATAGQAPLTDSDRTLRLVNFILCVISCVVFAAAIIPLAWAIPMTVHSWGIYKGTKANTVAFGVCTLIFVNLIGGILLLVSRKDA